VEKTRWITNWCEKTGIRDLPLKLEEGEFPIRLVLGIIIGIGIAGLLTAAVAIILSV